MQGMYFSMNWMALTTTTPLVGLRFCSHFSFITCSNHFSTFLPRLSSEILSFTFLLYKVVFMLKY